MVITALTERKPGLSFKRIKLTIALLQSAMLILLLAKIAMPKASKHKPISAKGISKVNAIACSKPV